MCMIWEGGPYLNILFQLKIGLANDPHQSYLGPEVTKKVCFVLRLLICPGFLQNCTKQLESKFLY